MEYITTYVLLMKGTLKRKASQARIWDFPRAGVQTLEKGHINTKRLRELNICETENCKIKVCELDLEESKYCGMIANLCCTY